MILFTQNGISQNTTYQFSSPIINKALPLPKTYDYTFPGINENTIISTSDVPNADIMISKISVIVDMTHDEPTEVQITLTDPYLLSVILKPFGTTEVPTAINPFNSLNTSRMKDFGGRRTNGTWRLSITDNKEGNVGRINYWQINIETQEKTTLFNIDETLPSLKLQVDGFGSFGDQGSGTNAGAIYQPFENIAQDNTVYHSVLYLHNEKIFLSSYDMYPTEPFKSVIIAEDGSNEFETELAIVSLKQELVKSATYDFTLEQTYHFNFKQRLNNSYKISRYVNSKLDPEHLNNYPAINFVDDGTYNTYESLTIFNQLIKSITEESTFIEIGYVSEDVLLFGIQVHKWNQDLGFHNLLHFRGLELYNNEIIKFPNDANEDGIPDDANGDRITDPGQGFDAALLLGIEIPAGSPSATFTMKTTWGYSSPSTVLQVSPEITVTPTPTILIVNTHTPTPTTPSTNTFTPTSTSTPTSLPTLTPTPMPTTTPAQTNTTIATPAIIPTLTYTNTNTPIPTSTKVPNYEPPQWVKRIPDLRFLQNTKAENVLNLDEYIYDPDTDTSAITYNIIKPDVLPITIENRSMLSMGETPEARDYGFITIQASDERTTIAQNIRVKISTFLTRSYYQIPPIILQPNEEWISPYSLDDLVIQKMGDQVIVWTFNNTIQGINEFEIIDNGKIRLLASNNPITNPQQITLVGMRGGLPTFTPTETFTPTATFTPTETYTQTATNTPTATNTITATPTPVPSSTPTSTFTNTLTPTFTATNTITPTHTATPTHTPTPQRTIVPSVTPSPTPTPTLGCSLRFNLNAFISTGVMTGPVELVAYPNGSLQPDTLFVPHLDEGAIGKYNTSAIGLIETGVIDTQLGTTNAVLADINNDGHPDALVLNVLEEQLELYSSSSNGSYTLSGTMPLNNEGIVQYDEPLNGYRYRGIRLESISNSAAVIALRTQSALLRIQVQSVSPRFSVLTRTAVNGNIRFIQSADLDADGDFDVIAAVNGLDGTENLFLYLLDEDGFTLQNSILVDTDFEGNFARDVALKDFNADGRLDIALLTFSNAVRIYVNNGNMNFTLAGSSNPFPPGVVQGFDAGDIDGNGSVDLVALHEDQNGLNLFVLCGNQPLIFTERLLMRIQPFVLQGQQYHLRLIDIDKDSDVDIVFTRSFFDDVITIENVSR